jgi:hypothetical protein
MYIIITISSIRTVDTSCSYTIAVPYTVYRRAWTAKNVYRFGREVFKCSIRRDEFIHTQVYPHIYDSMSECGPTGYSETTKRLADRGTALRRRKFEVARVRSCLQLHLHRNVFEYTFSCNRYYDRKILIISKKRGYIRRNVYRYSGRK